MLTESANDHGGTEPHSVPKHHVCVRNGQDGKHGRERDGGAQVGVVEPQRVAIVRGRNGHVDRIRVYDSFCCFSLPSFDLSFTPVNAGWFEYERKKNEARLQDEKHEE